MQWYKIVKIEQYNYCKIRDYKTATTYSIGINIHDVAIQLKVGDNIFLSPILFDRSNPETFCDSLHLGLPSDTCGRSFEDSLGLSSHEIVIIAQGDIWHALKRLYG